LRPRGTDGREVVDARDEQAGDEHRPHHGTSPRERQPDAAQK